MNPPKVSILLPVHRVALDHFVQALDSLYAQTMPDWELCLVGNQPDAEVWAYAQAQAREDARLRLLWEPRLGIASALNLGWQAARAAYVARMDADDVALPQRLQRQWEALEARPDWVALACQTELLAELEGGEGYAHFVAWQNSLLSPEAHALHRFVESPVAHPAMMFRRHLWEQAGGYSLEPWPEDYELWLRWMEAGWQLAKLPEVLLQWRDHAGRLSRNHAHYGQEAFYRLKAHYLAKYLRRILGGRPLVVAGSSRLVRRRAAFLEAEGLEIAAYTDVKRQVEASRFWPLEQIRQPTEVFVLSLVGGRGLGQAIERHFEALGFELGRDLLLAAGL